MKIRKFREYLDQKGKMQKKPVINAMGDTGPSPTKRPQSAVLQGKTWTAEAAALKDKPVPYSAPGKDPGHRKYEKGLGNDGPKDLIYEPETTDQRLMKSCPKSTMEQFIDETRDMSNAEFMDYIKSQHSANSLNLVSEVAKALSKSDYLLQHFIREMKRNDNIGKLMHEMFKHNETYQELAYLMANEKVCHNIAKGLNETVAPPAQETESPLRRKKNKEKAAGKRNKNSRTIDIEGEDLDMGDTNTADINVTSKMMKPEQNLINALLKYNKITHSINELFERS